MYRDFFKLKAEPFGITPDPDFLYLSPSHKEALASIIYGVRMRKGFVAVTGEAGVGKTTVIRSYLDSLETESVKVVYLFNANITMPVLLKTIFRELGLVAESAGVSDMIDQLHRELIKYYRNNVNVVLIIDEAQNMPVGTLENLRMLSNLETTKEKLMQIIFSGQPEFDRLLARNDLRQLKQRIAVKVAIRRLSAMESRAYIRHRLSRASNAGEQLFTSAAVNAIAGRAKGIPRTINILCGNALVTAFGYNKRRVGFRVAREVCSDMEPGWKYSPVVAYGAPVLAVIIMFAAIRLVPGAVSEVLSMASVRSAGTATRLLPSKGAAEVAVGRVNEPARTGESTAKPETEEGQGAPAAPAPEQPQVVNRVVGKGDNLTMLTGEVYGYTSDEVIDRVARYNPGIQDVNKIFEGDRIAFPVD